MVEAYRKRFNAIELRENLNTQQFRIIGWNCGDSGITRLQIAGQSVSQYDRGTL
jgi:hypothetical protein